MKTNEIQIFDAQKTADLLDFAALVPALKDAVKEYSAGRIISPERLFVPLQDGGVMVSMPSSAADLAIHKLVNVCPLNSGRQLPTIQGNVIAYDSTNGKTLFILDGPTVTGRRTAAMTALGVMALRTDSPSETLIFGTGKQAAYHVEALSSLFPKTRIWVKGLTEADGHDFVQRNDFHAPKVSVLSGRIPESVDLVVTITTSKTPVYDELPRSERLIVGVGAFTPDAAEISRRVIDGSSVVVDDPAGARHEAGDLIQAGFDWSTVISLASVIECEAKPQGPLFFKTVGCAAWDLAACRVVSSAIRAM